MRGVRRTPRKGLLPIIFGDASSLGSGPALAPGHARALFSRPGDPDSVRGLPGSRPGLGGSESRNPPSLGGSEVRRSDASPFRQRTWDPQAMTKRVFEKCFVNLLARKVFLKHRRQRVRTCSKNKAAFCKVNWLDPTILAMLPLQSNLEANKEAAKKSSVDLRSGRDNLRLSARVNKCSQPNGIWVLN